MNQNIPEAQVIYPVRYSQLTRTFNIANNRKIKITGHRIIRAGYIWEGISLMNAG